MKKKIFFSTILFFSIFTLVGVLKIKAEDLKAKGWIWSQSWDALGGIGWISLNSDNNPGSPIEYGISVPPKSCTDSNCAVKGYIWAGSNDNGNGGPLGWIDFNPQDHCVSDDFITLNPDQYRARNCNNPLGGAAGVYRDGDMLRGWSRIVGIAKETDNGNSGMWDGWIKMDPSSEGFGVKVDDATGTLSGYGWNGEYMESGIVNGLGALKFDTSNIALAPGITLDYSIKVRDNSSMTPVGLSPGEKLNDVEVSLTWKFVGSISSCRATCEGSDGSELNCQGWSNNSDLKVQNPANNGTAKTNMPETEVYFKLNCTAKNGVNLEVTPIKIEVGCGYGKCSSTAKCMFDSATFSQTRDGNMCKNKGCSEDSECEIRHTESWKEVNP